MQNKMITIDVVIASLLSQKKVHEFQATRLILPSWKGLFTCHLLMYCFRHEVYRLVLFYLFSHDCDRLCATRK